MKSFVIVLALSLAVLLVSVGCDLSEDNDTDVMTGPSPAPFVVLSVEPVDLHCGAGEFTYQMSARLENMPSGVRVSQAIWVASDGWTTALGPEPVRHTFLGCGLPGRESEGWHVTARFTLSDSSVHEGGLTLAPCSGC